MRVAFLDLWWTRAKQLQLIETGKMTGEFSVAREPCNRHKISIWWIGVHEVQFSKPSQGSVKGDNTYFLI